MGTNVRAMGGQASNAYIYIPGIPGLYVRVDT